MYSLVTAKLQGSLTYAMRNVLPQETAPLEDRRNAFLRFFGLYRSFERFLESFDTALIELESVSKGGAVVRTVVRNKLSVVKRSIGVLGNNICEFLPNKEGIFGLDDIDIEEKGLNELGFYRFFLSSPLTGRAKSLGMMHVFRELCPYVHADDGTTGYEIVYTLTGPTLSADRLYKGIDYDLVPFTEIPEHVARSLSKKIQRQLATRRIDIRSSEHLGELVKVDRNSMTILNQIKDTIERLIRNSFTIESLLSG